LPPAPQYSASASRIAPITTAGIDAVEPAAPPFPVYVAVLASIEPRHRRPTRVKRGPGSILCVDLAFPPSFDPGRLPMLAFRRWRPGAQPSDIRTVRRV